MRGMLLPGQEANVSLFSFPNREPSVTYRQLKKLDNGEQRERLTEKEYFQGRSVVSIGDATRLKHYTLKTQTKCDK